VLSFPAGIRVFLCTQPCDMRPSFDGPSMMAEHVIRRNPFSGHLFVFCNPAWTGPGEDSVLGPCRSGAGRSRTSDQERGRLSSSSPAPHPRVGGGGYASGGASKPTHAPENPP